MQQHGSLAVQSLCLGALDPTQLRGRAQRSTPQHTSEARATSNGAQCNAAQNVTLSLAHERPHAGATPNSAVIGESGACTNCIVPCEAVAVVSLMFEWCCYSASCMG